MLLKMLSDTISKCTACSTTATLLSHVLRHVDCAATEGEGGETGDEEQGGGGSKQQHKKRSGSDKHAERGMLKSPGQGQQMRSRTNGQADGVQQNNYSTPQQYQPQSDGFVDQSPIEYPAYRTDDTLTRFPSINMDWQTLRAPR